MHRRGFLASLAALAAAPWASRLFPKKADFGCRILRKQMRVDFYSPSQSFDLTPADVYTRDLERVSGQPKYISEDGSDGGTRRRVGGQA